MRTVGDFVACKADVDMSKVAGLATRSGLTFGSKTGELTGLTVVFGSDISRPVVFEEKTTIYVRSDRLKSPWATGHLTVNGVAFILVPLSEVVAAE